jgi:AcrR family transcriptional regulator
MPRPKKTPAEREATREEILDTTLAILQSEGVEAITSRAIAERMGVAHMSLFTYFANQAAILGGLRDREMARWREKQLALERRAQTEDIVGLVREMLEAYVIFAHENPNLFRLVWVMPEMIGTSPLESRERLRANVEHMARLLELGMERGAFVQRDPFLAAAAVLGMVNAPNILFYSGKLVDMVFRNRLVEELLSAAMQYLVSESPHSGMEKT